jgi:hypothetical protein
MTCQLSTLFEALDNGSSKVLVHTRYISRVPPVPEQGLKHRRASLADRD